MASRVFIATVLLLALCGLSNAWWNCHECIDSVTVNLQVTNRPFAGSDNEAKRTHYLDLIWFCNPQVFNRNLSEVIESHLAIAASILPNGTLELPTFTHRPVAVGYDTVAMHVPMNGLIIKGQSRTYKMDVDPAVHSVCGTCIKPIMLKRALIRAGHSDGIEVASASVFANYQDKCSGILAIDHSFENGRVDTTNYPDPAVRTLPLTKAGC